jgi:ribosomal protein S9
MSLEIATAEIEITPVVQVPIKTFAEPKSLTYEERQEMYNQMRNYYDIDKLPLPEEYFDNDVTSDRGLTQLQMDAHRVGLLNKGLLEVSPELEKIYRARLKRKIKLIRDIKGIEHKED